MKPEEFNDFLNDLLNEMQRTLETKEKTYSSGTDRFHNFIKAGKLDDKRAIDALRGMQTKHRVAIYDFLNKENITDTSYEEWREKIIDNINYYILMLGMVKEAFQEENKQELYRCPDCEILTLIPLNKRVSRCQICHKDYEKSDYDYEFKPEDFINDFCPSCDPGQRTTIPVRMKKDEHGVKRDMCFNCGRVLR